MVGLLKSLFVLALILVVATPAAAIGFAWWEGSRLVERAEAAGMLPSATPEGGEAPLNALESVAATAVFGRTWDVEGVPCRTGARFWLHYVTGGDSDGLSVSQLVARDLNTVLEPGADIRASLRQLGAACLLETRHSDAALLRSWFATARFGEAAGADAASTSLFGKPAANLNADEAARLIALLYDPTLAGDSEKWGRIARTISERPADAAFGAAATVAAPPSP